MTFLLKVFTNYTTFSKLVFFNVSGMEARTIEPGLLSLPSSSRHLKSHGSGLQLHWYLPGEMHTCKFKPRQEDESIPVMTACQRSSVLLLDKMGELQFPKRN